MDISTIEEKLRSGYYKKASEFGFDF